MMMRQRLTSSLKMASTPLISTVTSSALCPLRLTPCASMDESRARCCSESCMVPMSHRFSSWTNISRHAFMG